MILADDPPHTHLLRSTHHQQPTGATLQHGTILENMAICMF